MHAVNLDFAKLPRLFSAVAAGLSLAVAAAVWAAEPKLLRRRSEEDRSGPAGQGAGAAGPAAEGALVLPHRGLQPRRRDPRLQHVLHADGQEDGGLFHGDQHRHGRLRAGGAGPLRRRGLRQHHGPEVRESQVPQGPAGFRRRRQGDRRHTLRDRQLLPVARGRGPDRRPVRRPSLGPLRREARRSGQPAAGSLRRQGLLHRHRECTRCVRPTPARSSTCS